MPGSGSWTVLCGVIALAFGLLTLCAFDANRGNQPTDEKLETNFLSHESEFDALVQMLAADHPSLTAKGASAVDLRTMAGLDTSGVRLEMYRRLLEQISVADLRYFPGSGKIILVPNGQENPERLSKFYLYLPHALPQSFAQHHGYYWRGPRVDILTGDRRLRGSWFIRHEMTVEVAVTPY